MRGGGDVRDEGVELLGDPFWPFSREHVPGAGDRHPGCTRGQVTGDATAVRQRQHGVVGSPEHERRGPGYPGSQAASLREVDPAGDEKTGGSLAGEQRREVGGNVLVGKLAQPLTEDARSRRHSPEAADVGAAEAGCEQGQDGGHRPNVGVHGSVHEPGPRHDPVPASRDAAQRCRQIMTRDHHATDVPLVEQAQDGERLVRESTRLASNSLRPSPIRSGAMSTCRARRHDVSPQVGRRAARAVRSGGRPGVEDRI